MQLKSDRRAATSVGMFRLLHPSHAQRITSPISLQMKKESSKTGLVLSRIRGV